MPPAPSGLRNLHAHAPCQCCSGPVLLCIRRKRVELYRACMVGFRCCAIHICRPRRGKTRSLSAKFVCRLDDSTFCSTRRPHSKNECLSRSVLGEKARKYAVKSYVAHRQHRSCAHVRGVFLLYNERHKRRDQSKGLCYHVPHSSQPDARAFPSNF